MVGLAICVGTTEYHEDKLALRLWLDLDRCLTLDGSVPGKKMGFVGEGESMIVNSS